MTEKEELVIEKLLSLQFREETLKKIIVAAFDKHRKLLEENRKYKAAFMDLLASYADDVNELTETQASYCGDCCPLIGACPFNHDPEQDSACAEEIFKFYVENSNE
ncbi:MAG: hypothetical protein II968_05150 [Selenomonadaceae bacterium]|nr:hypothetical protein [Selenomonadaceae bacterium]